MLVSVSWLKNYVDIPVDTPTLARDLTMLGLNVERITTSGVSDPCVVIGRVLQVEPHPNADRLRVCRVDVGETDPLEIVCGAPNVAAGQLVPVARVGARLSGDLKIRKSKIRGVTSNGMICSEIELGLGDDAEGIMVLEGDFTPGDHAATALGAADDVLEIEVTPNRPDQLSHIGVAREVSALYVTPLKLPFNEVPSSENRSGLRIEIADPTDCPRYTGRVVRGVKVGPSPAWLKAALEKVGLHSVNNIVDATNYVLMETGQPLHAFDLRKLPGVDIGVRRARPGESLHALDGDEYELQDHYLIITASDEPVAVAGVIGGIPTSVTAETTDILIESAAFDFRAVRKTRRSMNISTDASYRFERGSDREACRVASDRACRLIAELTGATPEEFVDAYPAGSEPRRVTIRRSNTRRLLGLDLTTEEIARLLERLRFEETARSESSVTVVPPSYRADILEEADLVEEVARLHGYERIGRGWDFRVTTFARVDLFDRFTDAVSDHLVARGFFEVVTSSFTDGSEIDRMGWESGDERRHLVAVQNPLTSNQRFLRSSLIPGLVELIRRNLDRGTRRMNLFHVGKVFLAGSKGETGLPEERTMLIVAMTRPATVEFWRHSNKATDLFDIKEEIERLIATQGIDLRRRLDYGFEAGSGDFRYLHEKQALVEGGVLPPGMAALHELDQPVWYALVDLATLFSLAQTRSRLKPVPEYPVSKRDLSLVTPPDVGFARIEKSLVKHGGALLESVQVFDVYRGENIPDGTTAFGTRLVFRSLERTLTDAEIDRVVEKMISKLHGDLGVSLRS